MIAHICGGSCSIYAIEVGGCKGGEEMERRRGKEVKKRREAVDGGGGRCKCDKRGSTLTLINICLTRCKYLVT